MQVPWKALADRLRALLGAASRTCVRVGRAIWGAVTSARVQRAIAVTAQNAVRVGGFVARPAVGATRVLLLAAAAAGLVAGVFALTTQRTGPAQIAVRRSLWGGGVETRDRSSGLHLSIRGLHAWTLLDGRTHFLVFAPKPEGGHFEMLSVRTKDGNTAHVEVTVPYRIVQGEAHALVRDGLRGVYRRQARLVAEKVLLRELASLSSEDLMSTDARLVCAEATLAALNRELAPLHLEAEVVQIAGVRFPGAYEAKLQEKQLTEQKALLARAAAEVEAELEASRIQRETAAEVARVEAEVAMEVERLRAASQSEISAIELAAERHRSERAADAAAERDRHVAAGELALARAEALREELLGRARATAGGRLWLAREAARNLHFERIALDSSDPRVPTFLDLDEVVALLVGRE